MKIFVTGATGFIGRHFVLLALAAGHEIVALARSGPTLEFPPSKSCDWLHGDLSILQEEHFEGCNAFVHLAAHGVDPDNANWADCFRVNVTQSLNAWILAANAGIKRFVICGSCFEYGTSGEKFDKIPTDAPLRPTGPYHASKAAATMAAIALTHQKKLECLIARPFHVFGDGEADYRFWPSLRKAAISGHDFPMTDGKQVRDFVPVEFVAQKLLSSCLDQDFCTGTAKIQNIGTGTPQTLRCFAEEWWQKWGAKGSLLYGNVSYRKNEVMRFVPEM